MKREQRGGILTWLAILVTLLVIVGGLYFIFRNNREIVQPISASLGEEVNLKEGQTVNFRRSDLSLTVKDFVYSPCPAGAQCVWSGLGVHFVYTNDGKTEEGTNLAQAFGYTTSIINSDYKTYVRLKVEKTEDAPQTKTYEGDGFDVTYPTKPNLVVSETSVSIPTTTSTSTPIRGEKLAYFAPLEYCRGSGECIETTENVSIGFYVIQKNFSQTRSLFSRDLEEKKRTIGGREASYFEIGAEGEGMTYYIVSLDSSTTLLITNRYIDESVQSAYQGKEGFIPLAGQRALFENIIATIRFTQQM